MRQWGPSPPASPVPVTVLVSPGTYHEPSVLWADRRNITLAGATGLAADVVLTSSEGATLTVAADGATVRDLTVTSDVQQAGAVLVTTGRRVRYSNVVVLNGTFG